MVQIKNFDIYSLMRSQEIQEYYRSNIQLSVKQQISVITSCYQSLEEQRALLEWLYNKVALVDQQQVKQMMNLYDWMLSLIYFPEKIYFGSRYLYIVKRKVSKGYSLHNYFREGLIESYTDELSYCNNMSEVMDYIKSNTESHYTFYVDLIILLEDKSYITPLEFVVANVNGEYSVLRCYMDDMIEKCEDWKPAIEQYHNIYWHIELPYEAKSRIKLQLPFMDKAVYGILEKEEDGNGCWYNFLYPDEREEMQSINFLDLSYIRIGVVSEYSTFDWIERA